MSDFFTSHVGTSPNLRSKKRRALGAKLDPWLDRLLSLQGIGHIDRAIKPCSVLAVGIEVPGRRGEIHAVLEHLKRTSGHAVHRLAVPMADGLGKFANIERGLANVNLENFDWLVIVDDDVTFGHHALDRLITISEMTNLSISQPAHSLSSFASYQLTLRKPFSFIRETHFVEIGPLTAFRRDVFPLVIPFPASRWCYGIDLVWSHLAKKHSFKMGVVDAATIRHLRPVGKSYDMDAARAEGDALTKGLDLPSRAELLGYERIIPVGSIKAEAKKRWATYRREFAKVEASTYR